jgi:hypothetical protein
MEKFDGIYSIRYLKPEESMKLWLFEDDEWLGMVRPEPGIIYVDADKNVIYYLCPCGGTHGDEDCRKYMTHLPIDGSRGWGFQDNDGIPTITPSVFRKPPNGCHYFIRSGKVEWC